MRENLATAAHARIIERSGVYHTCFDVQPHATVSNNANRMCCIKNNNKMSTNPHYFSAHTLRYYGVVCSQPPCLCIYG